MREFSSDKKAYDESLKNAILLTEDEIKGKESHDIWKGFQPKFNLVNDLGKYYKFFKILLKSNLEECIKQNVFIVELRHISGMLFDDDRNSIPFPGELEIIEEVVEEVKKASPHPFEFILVITGLKIVGVSHVNKMLDHIRQGKEKFPHLIAGFDLVNEEEFTEPISAFMPEILGAIEDKRAESKTEGM